MRSATYASFGDPVEVVALTESPVPEPRAGEVRIRTILASIHNHDLLTIRGEYGFSSKLPTIAGSEAVGVVDLLGDGVDVVQAGQRVAVSGVQGAWAEYFVVPVEQVVPLSDSIDDETAAQLIAMPVSALGVLEFLGVKTGDWMVQNAANGAVGKALANLASARGVNLVNLVRRREAVEEMAALGITNTVATSCPGWLEQVGMIAGHSPIRAAIDSVGGRSTTDLVSVLSEGGVLASFGLMSGEPMQVDPKALIFKQLAIRGFWMAAYITSLSPQDMRRLVGEVVTAAANGTLVLPTEAVFDLADIGSAITANQRVGRKGKVLLRAR